MRSDRHVKVSTKEPSSNWVEQPDRESADNDEWRTAEAFHAVILAVSEDASSEDREALEQAYSKFLDFVEWSGLRKLRVRHMWEFIDMWDDCARGAD